MSVVCMCVYNYGHSHGKLMAKSTSTDVVDDVTSATPPNSGPPAEPGQ
jgi:hypothetical protein